MSSNDSNNTVTTSVGKMAAACIGSAAAGAALVYLVMSMRGGDSSGSSSSTDASTKSPAASPATFSHEQQPPPPHKHDAEILLRWAAESCSGVTMTTAPCVPELPPGQDCNSPLARAAKAIVEAAVNQQESLQQKALPNKNDNALLRRPGSFSGATATNEKQPQTTDTTAVAAPNNSNARSSAAEPQQQQPTQQQDRKERLLERLRTQSAQLLRSQAAAEQQRNVYKFFSLCMTSILECAGDPLAVAAALAEAIRGLVHADRCTVFVANDRARTLSAVIQGMPITLKYGEGIAGKAASERKRDCVNNAYEDERFNAAVDAESGYVTKTLLTMPLVFEGDLLAVVQLVNKLPHTKQALGAVADTQKAVAESGDGKNAAEKSSPPPPPPKFTDSDMDIFEAFVAVAGVVIHDALARPELRRLARSNRVMSDVSANLVTADLATPTEVAHAIADGVRRCVPGARAVAVTNIESILDLSDPEAAAATRGRRVGLGSNAARGGGGGGRSNLLSLSGSFRDVGPSGGRGRSPPATEGSTTSSKKTATKDSFSAPAAGAAKEKGGGSRSGSHVAVRHIDVTIPTIPDSPMEAEVSPSAAEAVDGDGTEHIQIDALAHALAADMPAVPVDEVLVAEALRKLDRARSNRPISGVVVPPSQQRREAAAKGEWVPTARRRLQAGYRIFCLPLMPFPADEPDQCWIVQIVVAPPSGASSSSSPGAAAAAAAGGVSSPWNAAAAAADSDSQATREFQSDASSMGTTGAAGTPVFFSPTGVAGYRADGGGNGDGLQQVNNAVASAGGRGSSFLYAAGGGGASSPDGATPITALDVQQAVAWLIPLAEAVIRNSCTISWQQQQADSFQRMARILERVSADHTRFTDPARPLEHVAREVEALCAGGTVALFFRAKDGTSSEEQLEMVSRMSSSSNSAAAGASGASGGGPSRRGSMVLGVAGESSNVSVAEPSHHQQTLSSSYTGHNFASSASFVAPPSGGDGGDAVRPVPLGEGVVGLGASRRAPTYFGRGEVLACMARGEFGCYGAAAAATAAGSAAASGSGSGVGSKSNSRPGTPSPPFSGSQTSVTGGGGSNSSYSIDEDTTALIFPLYHRHLRLGALCLLNPHPQIFETQIRTAFSGNHSRRQQDGGSGRSLIAVTSPSGTFEGCNIAAAASPSTAAPGGASSFSIFGEQYRRAFEVFQFLLATARFSLRTATLIADTINESTLHLSAFELNTNARRLRSGSNNRGEQGSPMALNLRRDDGGAAGSDDGGSCSDEANTGKPPLELDHSVRSSAGLGDSNNTKTPPMATLLSNHAVDKVEVEQELLDAALNSNSDFPIWRFIDGHENPAKLVKILVHLFKNLDPSEEERQEQQQQQQQHQRDDGGADDEDVESPGSTVKFLDASSFFKDDDKTTGTGQQGTTLEQLRIDETVLQHTIAAALRRYRDVPYHNAFHAFDVTQTCFRVMKLSGLAHALTPVERFALLLSAVFHDIDHNGLNNKYHERQETDIGLVASMAGQKSVLEYHHCQTAVRVIGNTGLLKHTPRANSKHVTQLLFDNVLATDMMMHHRNIVGQIDRMLLVEAHGSSDDDDGENDEGADSQQQQQQHNGGGSGGGAAPAQRRVVSAFDPAQEAHRRLAMKMCLKMADISNPAKDIDIGRRWGIAVAEEFHRQGDVERDDGLVDIEAPFDRNINTPLALSQERFIGFIAPFYAQCAKVFPKLEILVQNMNSNLEHWKRVTAAQ